MKNNHFNKLRELNRTYDFGDFNYGHGNKFTKKRSHKRSRKQLEKDTQEELKMMEEQYVD